MLLAIAVFIIIYFNWLFFYKQTSLRARENPIWGELRQTVEKNAHCWALCLRNFVGISGNLIIVCFMCAVL